MVKRTIISIFLGVLFIFSFTLPTQKVFAFDCLTLTPSSSQSDKDYCRKELAQIEAQLADLLDKQKEQQKQTLII